MSDLLQSLQSSIPLGEKFKKINQVSKTLSDAEVDEILRELRKSPLELDEVRLELANKFQRSSEVVEILKTSDRAVIQKAAKLPWLYKEGSPLTIPEYLEELFPKVAFTTRQKIINNLGNHLKDEKTADEIFQAIEVKYGFYIALPMIHACSEGLITDSVKRKKVQLLAPQLLAILKRLPQVGIAYLKDHYQFYADVDCCLNYLVDHHPEELLKLMKEKHDTFHFHLGNKRSKRILKSYPVESVELAQKSVDFFSIPQLQKRLTSEEYEKVFVGGNPKIGETIRSSWERDSVFRYLDHLPRKRQLEILRNAYKATYKKDLSDCPALLSAEIIAMLDPQEKAKVVTWKLANTDESLGYRFSKSCTSWYSNSKWFWTAFKPTSVAIPELTKFLNAEKDCSNRSSLYSMLILSCIVNYDSVQLLKVLQLLTKKSRNDQTDVRRELAEGMFHASEIFEFKKEHWACFEELLQICQLYKELRSISSAEDLYHKHIAFLMKNGQPIQEKINFFVKTMIQGNAHWDFKVSTVKGAEDQKKLIQAYITAFETNLPPGTTLDQTAITGIEDLAVEIVKWNKANQRLFGKINISDFRSLQSRVEDILLDDDNSGTRRGLTFELLRQDDKFPEEFLNKIFGAPEVELIPEALSFALQKFPEKITSNIDSIAVKILQVEKHPSFKLYFAFIRRLLTKNDPATATKQNLKEACESILANEDPESVLTETKNAIKILAVLVSSEEFLSLAAHNYPTETKIDASVPIDEVDYAKKLAIADSLKYLKDTRLALKAVDRFAAGDYLKLVLGSLYSVCNALPQEEILSFLRTQLKHKPAVSVKKHMIRLFFLISPLGQKSGVLKQMWAVETNPSIRFEILSQFYQLLKNNVTEEVYQDLKSAINSLTAEDTPSLDHLKTCQILDDSLDSLTSDFFQTILSTLKRTESDEQFELQVLGRLVEVISKVSGTFLDSLLQDILYRSKSSNEHTFSSVTVKYLSDSSVSDQVLESRLKLFSKILKDLYENHWEKIEVNYGYGTTTRYSNKHLVNTIFRGICSEICDGKNVVRGTKIGESVLELLESIQDVSKTFFGRLYLQLALLTLADASSSSKGERSLEKLRKVGKGIGALIDSYVGLYGAEILSLTNDIVQEFWNSVLQGVHNDDDIVAVIEGILTMGSKYSVLTAIALLPDQPPKDEDLSLIFNKVTAAIRSSEHVSVKIFFESNSTR